MGTLGLHHPPHQPGHREPGGGRLAVDAAAAHLLAAVYPVQVPVCSCPVRDMEQVLPVRPGPGASGLHLMPALPLPPYIATIAACDCDPSRVQTSTSSSFTFVQHRYHLFIMAHFEIK